MRLRSDFVSERTPKRSGPNVPTCSPLALNNSCTFWLAGMHRSSCPDSALYSSSCLEQMTRTSIQKIKKPQCMRLPLYRYSCHPTICLLPCCSASKNQFMICIRRRTCLRLTSYHAPIAEVGMLHVDFIHAVHESDILFVFELFLGWTIDTRSIYAQQLGLTFHCNRGPTIRHGFPQIDRIFNTSRRRNGSAFGLFIVSKKRKLPVIRRLDAVSPLVDE